jgi:succinyl-CoA synthetase alpha subunit
MMALYLAGLSEREKQARFLGVSYVPLDGDIAVITSGAGLGMATLDMLKRRNLQPANFLDTGGGISADQVKCALELVMDQPRAGAIINLYGGINRMLEAAKGSWLRRIYLTRPIVVKILGNQQEELGNAESEPDIHQCVSFKRKWRWTNLSACWDKAMAHILLHENTRAIVQGITGKVGQAQTRWMLEAGTPIVAGVTPGKGGQSIEGLPVYDTVAEAVAQEGGNASVIFVPALFARQAAFEAVDENLDLVVIVTEHIPIAIHWRSNYAPHIGGDRPQLPWHPGPRNRQAGHYAAKHLYPGQYWRGWPQCHAILRSNC